ncbi:hypothetical protein GCM10023347_48260 [Streptomyces chumphonensis]
MRTRRELNIEVLGVLGAFGGFGPVARVSGVSGSFGAGAECAPGPVLKGASPPALVLVAV